MNIVKVDDDDENRPSFKKVEIGDRSWGLFEIIFPPSSEKEKVEENEDKDKDKDENEESDDIYLSQSMMSMMSEAEGFILNNDKPENGSEEMTIMNGEDHIHINSKEEEKQKFMLMEVPLSSIMIGKIVSSERGKK